MKKVIVESPFAGNTEINVDYARKCLRHCLLKGESPLASHLLYTQKGILDDNIPKERCLGIAAGLAWHSSADKVVVYTDLGISEGMALGIAHAERLGIPVEYRKID